MRAPSVVQVTLIQFVALLLSACVAARAVAQDVLPSTVAAELARAGLPAEAFGAVALPISWWHTRWEHRARVPMQPASTMKLVTSVVALERLGPGHRGRTELLTDAPLRGDLLDGDLFLRGGADTDLGLPQLRQLLLDLRQQGVREIAGDLVVDRHLFRPARADIGVPPFDDAPEWPYNGIPDALQLNGNLVGIELRSDAKAVQARLVPALAGVRVVSALDLNDKPCDDWDEDWRTPASAQQGGEIRIELRGGFPRECSASAELLLVDRDVLTDRYVRMLWQELGGTLRGRTREAATPAGGRVLAAHEGRPLAQVLQPVNKQSDNPLARLLFLTIGARSGTGDATTPTRELTTRSVLQWFAEKRIAAGGLVLDNGSGLSRSERITPLQLARVLRAAHAGRHGNVLLASLPIAGVDGTMRSRLKDSPAAGRARIKTGTLANATAIAGFVPDPAGREWIVVAFINHEQARSGRGALDAFIDWVARGGPMAVRYDIGDVGGP